MIIACGMDTRLDLVWRFDQAQSIPLLSLTLCAKSSLDYRPDLEAQQFHFIPHSGWAALQIVLGYFETIAYFKQGDPSLLKKHGELFKWGVDDVFQNFKDHNPKLRNALWEELRGGLYHSGIAKSKISIEHREPSVFCKIR